MHSASSHSLHAIRMLLATSILFTFIVLLSSEGPLLLACPLSLLTDNSKVKRVYVLLKGKNKLLYSSRLRFIVTLSRKVINISY